MGDDVDLAEAARRALRQLGAVQTASNLQQAARYVVGPQEWAALIVDVGLPDGSGLELLAAARARGRAVPALVLTTTVDRAIVNRSFELRAQMLCKPVAEEQLRTFARQALRPAAQPDLRPALEAFARRNRLTRAETEVLVLAAMGSTHDRMCESLHIARGTLKKHVQNLLRKTDDTTILAVTTRALREWLRG